MPKWLYGSIVGVLATVALGAAMVPLRSHLSIATTGLVLVVPVVAGVVTGGLEAGVVSMVAGFLVYDFAFIPPYYTLTVGAAQNWVALGVYAVVMLMVAQVVSRLDTARTEAHSSAAQTRRLYELSDLLVKDRPIGDLLDTIVTTVQTAFGVPGVALLLPEGDRLQVVSSAGEPISAEQLRQFDPGSGTHTPVSVGTTGATPDRLQTVALSTSEGPVGVLAVRGLAISSEDRALLGAFANHAAIAIERARLREQALQTEVLREIDRLRQTLLGAVSHDLRTPLASMKIASTTLRDPTLTLSAADMDELYDIIDRQTDRLTRLVTSLLDMTRLQAGVLEVQRDAWSVADLADEGVAGIEGALGANRLEIVVPDHLPLVLVDPVLVGQVITNLVENADRHAPAGTAITIGAGICDDRVVMWVADEGPGVPPEECDAIFDSFVRFDTGGRSGLGLAIAKTFIQAHGERIWVENVPAGGARFLFTLAPAPTDGLEG
jgi:two-component system sensor histidine kinase KdpD